MKSVAVLTFVHWANPSFWYLIWIDAILEEPPLVTTRNAALGPGALFSGLLYTDKIYGILHCQLFNFQDKKRWATATIIRIRSILKFYCCLWHLNALIETIKQQDGWKTQDGTRTKKCHARPGMHRPTRPIRDFKIHYGEVLLRRLWPSGTRVTTANFAPNSND